MSAAFSSSLRLPSICTDQPPICRLPLEALTWALVLVEVPPLPEVRVLLALAEVLDQLAEAWAMEIFSLSPSRVVTSMSKVLERATRVLVLALTAALETLEVSPAGALPRP